MKIMNSGATNCRMAQRRTVSGALCPSTSCSTSGRTAVIRRASKARQHTGQHEEQHGAGWLAGFAAAIILCSGSQPAHATMAEAPFPMSDQGPTTEEERRYDEKLMTAELRSFVDLLQSKGSNIKQNEVEAPRLKLGIQRSVDGRVSLRSREGRWYNVKADMQASGFLLLRNELDGRMFFLPPDDGGQLLQVDLSDDAVVAQLFSSGAWFDVMEPLKVETSAGLAPLQLSPFEFRTTYSLLEDAVDE